MTQSKLQKILSAHAAWLKGDLDGVEAKLSWANLTWANLAGANLTGANLSWANLAGVDLTEANLTGANLAGANLAWANLDFASWPLCCGSKNPKIDERIARRLLAHAFAVAKGFCTPTPEQIEFCNGFHRIVSGEFPKLAE